MSARPSTPLLLKPLDQAMLKLVRALARDAAREDHDRESKRASDETRGNLRPVLD
jgi:hypothetical protein